jgi:hypothetical protein
MRTRILALVVLIFATLLAASPAQAKCGGSCSADDGAVVAAVAPILSCELSSTTRARVQFSGLTVSQANAKVDASNINYYSYTDTQRPAAYRPDVVRIELYDASGSGWVKWTQAGGTTGDGKTVPSPYNWDPSAKFVITDSYTRIRMRTWRNDGIYCTSPPANI